MLSGLPGAGKSALADDLRTALPAVVLSVDPVEDAMYRAGIDHAQPAGLAAYVVVEAMAEPALRAGQAVVIDAVNAAVGRGNSGARWPNGPGPSSSRSRSSARTPLCIGAGCRAASAD